MTASHRSTIRTAALVVLAALTACGDRGGSAEVEIEIDRLDAWTFVVAGGARGPVCDRGVARAIDFSDLDGAAISIWEYQSRRERRLIADPPDVSIEYLTTAEFDCSDGSGAFTMTLEERNGGPWEIVGGAGAYRDLVGSGTVMMERDPPTEDWHPPGGLPHFMRLTGELRLPPDD